MNQILTQFSFAQTNVQNEYKRNNYKAVTYKDSVTIVKYSPNHNRLLFSVTCNSETDLINCLTNSFGKY
jgi:hypothetical protein